MPNKNIILIGANGSGKTSIAKYLYLKGYHNFKLSPLSDNNTVSASLAYSQFGVVFDRWGPLDLAIYRHDNRLLQDVVENYSLINENNIIILLENANNYSDEFDPERVVQRPPTGKVMKHVTLYRNYVRDLSNAGLKIFHVSVNEDLNITLKNIERIIKENENA